MNKWNNAENTLPEISKVDEDYDASKEVVGISIHGNKCIVEYQTGEEDGGWSHWWCKAYEDTVNIVKWCDCIPLDEEVC